MDDGSIIKLYFDRDENAISATDEKYGNYLGAIAYNILNDRFDAGECVNDTYFKVWQIIPPQIPRIFSAFLAKITRNLALDKYKSKSRDKRRVSESALSLNELEECVSGEYNGDLDSRIITECINRHLSRSSEADRRIFVLRYFYSESIADISKKMKFSETRIKTSLFRSRERLKKILIEEGVY